MAGVAHLSRRHSGSSKAACPCLTAVRVICKTWLICLRSHMAKPLAFVLQSCSMVTTCRCARSEQFGPVSSSTTRYREISGPERPSFSALMAPTDARTPWQPASPCFAARIARSGDLHAAGCASAGGCDGESDSVMAFGVQEVFFFFWAKQAAPLNSVPKNLSGGGLLKPRHVKYHITNGSLSR